MIFVGRSTAKAFIHKKLTLYNESLRSKKDVRHDVIICIEYYSTSSYPSKLSSTRYALLVTILYKALVIKGVLFSPFELLPMVRVIESMLKSFNFSEECVLVSLQMDIKIKW